MTKRETQNYGPRVSCLRGARGDGDVSPSFPAEPRLGAFVCRPLLAPGCYCRQFLWPISIWTTCVLLPQMLQIFTLFFLVSASLEHVCREVPCSCVRAFTNSSHTHVHTHPGVHTRDGLALRVFKLAYGNSCEAH